MRFVPAQAISHSLVSPEDQSLAMRYAGQASQLCPAGFDARLLSPLFGGEISDIGI